MIIKKTIEKDSMSKYIGDSGSTRLLKELNLVKIYRLILIHRPVSRIQLSKLSGLNKVTVSSCVDFMIKCGLLLEIGEFQGCSGRPAVLLDINPKFGILLSIELHSIRSRVLATDMNGNVLYNVELPKEKQNIADVIDSTAEIKTFCEQQFPDMQRGVVGVCFSVPNNYNYSTGIVEYISSMPECNGFGLRQRLKEALPGVPCFIQQACTSAAIGETQFGISDPLKHLAYLYISWGINLSIYQAGEAYRGSHGFAGRFGHTIIEPKGRLCTCGNRGCLETYASVHSLLCALYPEKKVLLEKDSYVRYCMFEETKKRIAEQEEKATNALLEVLDMLVIAGINIINLYNPEQICIGGYLSELLTEENILEMADKVYGMVPSHMSREVKIMKSQLGRSAALFGGAAVVRDNLMSIIE